MGLCKEGILAESEVSAFRSHLLDTLIVSLADHEHSLILRDKLIFLQELLYAKCISEEEHHSSKRMKNLILAKKIREKQNSALKQIKGAASVFGFAKHGKIKEERGILNPVSENRSLSERNELGVSTENPFWNTKNDSETKSILMVESLPKPMKVKKQKKPFKGLFGVGDQHRPEPESEGKSSKSGKKLTWGFDGFKKWKKNDSEDETAPLSLNEKSDGGGTYLGQLVAEPVGGGGPDTKQIKRSFILMVPLRISLSIRF
ncbi:hypothetical protein K7X08_022647 [Anisodus acutangulus]|uniref:Uncharacterized protein n=1 Tax=Anisodus acutangulus TaxID=402998 RepID=A0A9Q1RK57_9SOLA|nr:hypothetical protein K7X08_022647 [Anisodus acutangulus]